MKVSFQLMVVLLIASPVWGQAVGKLSGTVRDARNNEPLPGVNIVLEGNNFGATTDLDGTFIMLNVPAGTHAVNFSYIGYTPQTITNVRVVADITKRLEVALDDTVLEIGEEQITIVDRPFFEVADQSVDVISSDEIERIPIKGINSIVAINSSVVVADGSGGETDNAVLNVRGGRGNETLIIIDGVIYNDAVLGNATGTIPDAAIEQVSSTLGGFSAKYGNAQAGVVNITTKGGNEAYFGGFDAITSQAVDVFDYNSVTGFLGGPLLPGSKRLSFFISAEYLDTRDDQPRASGLIIPTAGFDQDFLPDNESDVLRFTGKLDGNLGPFKMILSTNGSFRNARTYVHTYAKNNSQHNPRVDEDVLGGSLRLSNVINTQTFWDITLRSKLTKSITGDGVYFDDLEAYGDAGRIFEEEGVVLPNGNGDRIRVDGNGVFFDRGRVSDFYRKYDILTAGADANITRQMGSHLLELGLSANRDEVRYWSIAPVSLALNNDSESRELRYAKSILSYYGYDLFGNEVAEQSFRTVDGDRFEEAAPKRPVTAGAYVQDKIELQDLILNFGLRWDYFQPDFNRLRDPENIFGFGENPNRLDEADFEPAPAESYLSPRLGFAFPVTEKTIFHAAYGIFRQPPRLFDLYDSWVNIDIIEQRDGQGQNNGHLQSEKTTQYEFGFKHQIGNVASLDITAYYRNVQGLTNSLTERTAFGQTNRLYITRANLDFGTIKGFAFGFNLRRLGPVTTKVDYTFALNEGTGSSPTSSRIATFRNPNNEVPLAIAPLDFDQRHTLTANVDIRGAAKQGPSIGKFSLLENAGVNFLLSYSSGRPYTALESVNLLTDASQYGNVTYYVNSAYAQGIFRIDMKADKTFNLGSTSIVPYLWIQNLLNRENFNTVWPSTGQPDDTGFLATPAGQALIRAEAPGFASDYRALERDPTNYGTPRLVRVGLIFKF